METKAKRTLVKSAPELWELADDPERMEAWISSLVEPLPSAAIEVIERSPNRRLAWRAAGDEPGAAIAVEMTEKGFGTAVEITAEHRGEEARDVLESLLDELGSPERRPFIGG
jgi:hypothetical protein